MPSCPRALPTTPAITEDSHSVIFSANDSDVSNVHKPSVTNTEDIKYVFDTAPICDSDEGWDYSSYRKEDQNPEPLIFGQPMQGKRH
jgi:hypothetical protein